MSDYTPTTDDVGDAWCSRYDGEHSWASGEERRGYEGEFDRWLDQTLREAKAEAWDEGLAARPVPTREQLADALWDALEDGGWVSTSGHYPYEIADAVLALLKGQDA